MLTEKTMLQNHLNSLMDVGIDQIIIINENGRADDWTFRNKIVLSRDKQEIFLMSVLLHHSMMRDFDGEFGPAECTIIERQNIKLVSIPFYSYVVLAMMGKNVDHEFLVGRIHEIKNIHANKLLEEKCLRMEVLANHG
ncbi:MAG TPA: hypothetical protein VFW99_00360 [Candidatus Nitrosotalea sp.]|nr:hypothetical protein [Candidatus Nitrosotalea sp.]